MIGKGPVSYAPGAMQISSEGLENTYGWYGMYQRRYNVFLRLVGQVPKGGTTHTKGGYKFGIGISFKSWTV